LLPDRRGGRGSVVEEFIRPIDDRAEMDVATLRMWVTEAPSH